MSVYLTERVKNKLPNIQLDVNSVENDTVLTLNCLIHGDYTKTVHQILYKNANCPKCVRIQKNKKLSEIGKTKVGELNSFYGHTHSEETIKKLSEAWTKNDNTERKAKISQTIKSEECQNKRRKTLLKQYGDENYNNREQARQTNLDKFGEISYAKTTQFRQEMSDNWTNKTEEEIKVISDKVKQTKKEHYGDENYNNRDKAKQTCLELYGVDIPNKYGSDMYYENMAKKYGESWLSIVGQKANIGIHKNISKFETEHDCINYVTVIKKYGQGWLSIKDTIKTIKNNNNIYIPNDELYKIIKYNEEALSGFTSHKEKDLIRFIQTFYNGKIIENDRKVIKPKELDIYLPELQLAIEFNGTFWHSIQADKPKEYHLIKSLMCRDKGVRLIHIYEFEDINKQKQLLKDLILGTDNYPKDDFNKNNLIDDIPKPKIVYKDNKYTIYGAGKLMEI